MGEIKSVKVDNWGVFFLQKLQNFFNKTDYCDLTLQFRDNSQLKVHRLVLSACTDYFNVLEQNCEVVDDAIIMPNGLQADVVVPIVNFMYTGTLEFELKMYNRLLKTAKDMNMTVLLKLLEAHRRTMEMHPHKSQAPSSPKLRRKPTPVVSAAASTTGRSLIAPQQQKRIISVDNNSQQQQRTVQVSSHTRATSSSVGATTILPVKQQIGSTTLTRIKHEPEQDENLDYTLLRKPNQHQQQVTTSPFEQLRKGYSNNKRPAATSFISPPAKKPNIEDVKEFAEQQRMRKQIAAEFGDDGDYDAGIMDDDTIHNDDDDDDMAVSTAPTSSSAGVQTSSTQQESEDPPGTTTIIVKHEGPDKPPTIVVKDSANSKMNHGKIISEVLRQYPHLVNSNRNIKLKIMPNAGGQTQKIIVKKEPAESEKEIATATVTQKVPTIQRSEDNKVLVAPPSVGVSKQKLQSMQSANSSTNRPEVASSTSQQAATTSVPTAPPQKRRIDSKTMHALIALGAENTTGPWLCLRCGRNGHPISIPSYRGFRRHLINTHKETIDASLCEHCGWRSVSIRELHFHMQLEHKIKTNLYIFPECQLCHQMCINSDGLNRHLIESHPDENKQQCIYCNKIFPEELELYTHMKTFHKKQALEDGIIDYSDDDNVNAELALPPLDENEMDVDHTPTQQDQEKIKILSDISLPITSSISKTDLIARKAEQMVTTGESTTSVVSEEYLQEHVETKFVAADGSEVILTDEQRKEILSQLNQENDGSGVVMVLNENQHYEGSDVHSDQGVISQDETSQATTASNDEHEDHDDSQIYNELKRQREEVTEEEDVTNQTEPESTGAKNPKGESPQHDVVLDESKESVDNLEWAENLISEHDMADEMPEADVPKEDNKVSDSKEEDNDKSQEDISEKLKELAGDWSENDEDDEEMLVEQEPHKLDDTEEKCDQEILAPAETQKDEEDIDHEMTVTEQVSKNIQKEKDIETEKIPEDETINETDEKPEKEEKAMEEGQIDEEAEALTEDDVDLALQSLHKESDDEEINNQKNIVEEQEEENIEQEQEDAEKTTEIVSTSSKDLKESGNDELTTVTEMIVDEEEIGITSETSKEEVEVKSVNDECKTSTSLEEDKTKKDLMDILLSEHASTVDEAKRETLESLKMEDDDILEKEEEFKADNLVDAQTTDDVEKNKDDMVKEVKTLKEEKKLKEEDSTLSIESSGPEPLVEDEFLSVTPEKIMKTNEDLDKAGVSIVEPEAQHSPKASDKKVVSSEERVKSLVSEWGDDDDEDENEDTDLKASL